MRMPASGPGSRKNRWCVRLPVAMAVLTIGTLGGCADPMRYAPASDLAPWQPDASQQAVSQELEASTSVMPGASATPTLGEWNDPPKIEAQRAYDLPALIDIAQRHNASTRIAWGRARQAASAVGLVEATYLPMLSANVVGGYQQQRTTLPEVLGRRERVDTEANGVVGGLAVQWLLFDFGQRGAARDAAANLSIGANYLYNGAHQKLIYDVARSYYEFGAARERSRIAQETLKNSKKILDAATQRRRNGLATTIEVAQAQQLVAQAQLKRVVTGGEERNTYQALLGAMGVSPLLVVKVADVSERPLPAAGTVPTEALLKQALAARPDVLAAMAALRASRSAVDVARADFLPKVYLAGFTATGNGNLDVRGIPGVNQQAGSSGVLVGVSLPLYDGGLRSSRVQDAQARVVATEATFEKIKSDSMREIVVISNTLESALASYEAAASLVKTSALTYDATLEAYQQGVGTVTAVTEGATALLQAKSARVDAHAASLISAASLAFALGQLTGGAALTEASSQGRTTGLPPTSGATMPAARESSYLPEKALQAHH